MDLGNSVRARGPLFTPPPACACTATALERACTRARPGCTTVSTHPRQEHPTKSAAESHELDPGLDEVPGGPTLVAHIVPLHHPHDGPLVGAAAVAWQPEPGLEALHGDGALLPAASEDDPSRLKGVSFGACWAGIGVGLVG